MLRPHSRAAALILGALLAAAAAAPARAFPPVRRFPPPAPQPAAVNQPRQPAANNPASPPAPGFQLNPFAFRMAALGRALAAVSPYGLGASPYSLSAAYSPSMMGYGSYASPMMYPMNYGGYGAGSGGTYGQAGATQQSANYSTMRTAPSLPPARGGALLGLLNDDGDLDWPVAVRILPPALEAQALRKETSLLARQVLLNEASYGQADPGALRDMKRDVGRLRALLADRAELLPISREATDEGKRFLRKLEAVVNDLEEGGRSSPPSGSGYPPPEK